MKKFAMRNFCSVGPWEKNTVEREEEQAIAHKKDTLSKAANENKR